jgi:DNA replication protein DnaC
MDIWQNFSDLTLTEDQKMAVEKIERFLLSDNQVFLLKGYAGTGKTTILKGIANYLLSNQKLAAVMAPTGRAAKILRDKTGISASTIHRIIYNYNNLEQVVSEDANDESFKYHFTLSRNELEAETVFIVDEASMVGENFNENEFIRFGSGHLLSDLLQFVNLHSLQRHKIIFVGDPAQLEPVGDKDSKALDASYFEQLKIKVRETELTQILRQKSESGILANAMKYRELLQLEKRNENYFNSDFNDIEVLQVDNVAKEFVDIVPVPEINKAAIITFSNNLANSYNTMVRQHYFPDKKDIQVGDILIIAKNHYTNDMVLFNGESVKVTSVEPCVEKQSARVFINKVPKIVDIYFKSIEIFVPGEERIIPVKIIINLLNSRERDLSSTEYKALYINFIMRFKDKQNKQIDYKSNEFKESIRMDDYFNALHVKYGYAFTCHKAQGGEWDNAFVDFSGRIGLKDAHLRWDYTAITRAAKKLFVINPPLISAVHVKKIGSITKLSKSPDEMYFFEEPEVTPFHSLQSHPAKRLKYFQMLSILKDTKFSIQKVDSKEWQEIYFLSDAESEHRVEMRHAKAGILAIFDVRSPDKDELMALFSTDYLNELNFIYRTENKILNQLYQKLNNLCEKYDAKITNVVDEKLDTNSFANFFIKTKANAAYLQCYINKDNQISSILPKSVLGTDDTILQNILAEL